MKFWAAATLALAAQDSPAREALQKCSDRMREVKTLSAQFIQERRSALMNEPLRSSGELLYRRDPARLVFRVKEPRNTIIHYTPAAYTVFRPDDKQAEEFTFDRPEVLAGLFMAFQPNLDEIGKSFRIKGEEAGEGKIRVALEPKDEKITRILTRLTLTISREGELGGIAYLDAQGDEIRFDLVGVLVNPDVPADRLELRLPEGTRLLRHKIETPR